MRLTANIVPPASLLDLWEKGREGERKGKGKGKEEKGKRGNLYRKSKNKEMEKKKMGSEKGMEGMGEKGRKGQKISPVLISKSPASVLWTVASPPSTPSCSE